MNHDIKCCDGFTLFEAAKDLSNPTLQSMPHD
jgi:hypothetical protein